MATEQTPQMGTMSVLIDFITLDSRLIPYLSTALLALFVWFSLENPKTANFPLLNKKREAFDIAGIDLVRNWLTKNGDQPVNVTSDAGPFAILPPKYAYELRDRPELNFATLNYKVQCVSSTPVNEIAIKSLRW